ncbi:MAG: hypothetical protein AAGB24_13045 [Bacteroidota bacterium]
MKNYILIGFFLLGICAQSAAQMALAYRDKLGNAAKTAYAFKVQKTLDRSVKDKYQAIWAKSPQKVQQWAKKEAQKADTKSIKIGYSPSGKRFTALSVKQQRLLRFLVIMESYELLSCKLAKYSSKEIQEANRRLYHELVQLRDERVAQAEDENGQISKKDADASNSILSKL